MRYPEFLKENGTIGFVAPSFGCDEEPYISAFKNAQNKWKEAGYKLDLGPNCYVAEGVGISNTPEKCGRELTEYYVREENDCLISCGGGELMCEILNHVDFDAVKKAAPKWYMGYSDNTNMTFLLTTLCDTASIYGPCAASFGMEPWHPSIADAFALLTGEKLIFESYDKWEKESVKDAENPLLPYNCTEPLNISMFVPDGQGSMKRTEEASMEGRLLGGCMDCLVNLLGTKFDKVNDFTERYKEDGIIWFLEACDLNVFGIRRAMWQMENAGWFQHVKGFLIGRPLNGEAMMNLDHFEAVLSTAGKYQVPVIMDVDLGHFSPMMPLITGSMAKINGQKGKIQVSMVLK
ncbi:MAG: LD-carboxypeptidase [Lachnospiraceae bacterium]|nr:LD-carboxypeptidase [Lachnospiraceae bacterium]